MTTVFFLNLTTAAFTIVDACKFPRVFTRNFNTQMTAEFEQMLLVAILDNCEEQHARAQAYAREHNFTQKQVDTACKRVLSFLRWHGIQKLQDNEKKALVKMQAFFRRLLVQKKLRKQMEYWERLAKIDDVQHFAKAEQIYKVLQPKKKKQRIAL